MAALVQSFPSPSSTLTMLQPRSPSSDAFQAGPTSQQHQRNSQMQRTLYNSSVGGMAAGNYRGHTTITPVAPYAFTNTPVVSNAANPLRQHPTLPFLRHENRTSSAPAVQSIPQPSLPDLQNSTRQRPQSSTLIYPALDLSNGVPLSQKPGSKDDHSISTANSKQTIGRPLSAIELNSPALSNLSSQSEATKPIPERYRRNHRRIEKGGQQSASSFTPSGSVAPSGSGMGTVGHLYANPLQASSTPSLTSYPVFRGSQSFHGVNEAGPQTRLVSMDDMNLPKQSLAEQAKRYRRKSVSSLEVKDHASSEVHMHAPVQLKTMAALSAVSVNQERRDAQPSPPLQRPSSSHDRHDSNGSSNSSRSASRPSSVSDCSLLLPLPARLVTLLHRLTMN